MAKREPKARTTTMVEVVGRPGARRGRLELRPGHLVYTRQGAKGETIRLTYQQLISLLEREVECRALESRGLKLPKGHPDGDFFFEVHETDEAGDLSVLFSSAPSFIEKVDARRVDCGAYQFSSDMASGRKHKSRTWFSRVSVQAAIWIVDRYIEKWLLSRKLSDFTDSNVVVSKRKMREIALHWGRSLD